MECGGVAEADWKSLDRHRFFAELAGVVVLKASCDFNQWCSKVLTKLVLVLYRCSHLEMTCGTYSRHAKPAL